MFGGWPGPTPPRPTTTTRPRIPARHGHGAPPHYSPCARPRAAIHPPSPIHRLGTSPRPELIARGTQGAPRRRRRSHAPVGLGLARRLVPHPALQGAGIEAAASSSSRRAPTSLFTARAPATHTSQGHARTSQCRTGARTVQSGYASARAPEPAVSVRREIYRQLQDDG